MGEGYQTDCTAPCATSGLNPHESENGPEIITQLSYLAPSREYSPLPGSRTFTPSTLKQYHQSCSPSGPTVTDQTPWSSLVSGISVPISQAPWRTTDPALGASSRKVTLLSERTSGDTTRGPGWPRPGAGCENKAPALNSVTMTAPIEHLPIKPASSSPISTNTWPRRGRSPLEL